MKITLDEARRVAALACLEFDDTELNRTAGEMSEILDYVDQLSAADVTSGTANVDLSSSSLREDEEGASTPLGDIQANAPSMIHDHFVVPKVIGGE